MDEQYDVLLNTLPQEKQQQIIEVLDDVEENTKKMIDMAEQLKRPHYELLQYIDGIKNNTVVIGDVQEPLDKSNKQSRRIMQILEEQKDK